MVTNTWCSCSRTLTKSINEWVNLISWFEKYWLETVPLVLVNIEWIHKALFYNNKQILYMPICYWALHVVYICICWIYVHSVANLCACSLITFSLLDVAMFPALAYVLSPWTSVTRPELESLPLAGTPDQREGTGQTKCCHSDSDFHVNVTQRDI